MSIEIRNVNYKINRDVQYEDKNLEIITIKILAKNRNKDTQGVSEIVGQGN